MKRRFLAALILLTVLANLSAADFTLGLKGGYAIRKTRTSVTTETQTGSHVDITTFNSRYVPLMIEGKALFPLSDSGFSLGLVYGTDILQIPAGEALSAIGNRIQFDPYAGLVLRYSLTRLFSLDGFVSAGWESARPESESALSYNGAVTLGLDAAISLMVSHFGLSAGINARFPVYTLSNSEGKRISGYTLIPYLSLCYRF